MLLPPWFAARRTTAAGGGGPSPSDSPLSKKSSPSVPWLSPDFSAVRSAGGGGRGDALSRDAPSTNERPLPLPLAATCPGDGDDGALKEVFGLLAGCEKLPPPPGADVEASLPPLPGGLWEKLRRGEGPPGT